MWPITSLVNIKESSTHRFTYRIRRCSPTHPRSGCKVCVLKSEGVCPLLEGVLGWEGEVVGWIWGVTEKGT